MKLKLLVIRSKDIHLLVSFYKQLGLEFEYHQHGKGPMHYSCLIDDVVFELYPLLKDQKEVDSSTRIGFEVENLDRTIERLKKENTLIIQMPQKSSFGYTAVVKDPDGRKLELTHKH